MCLLLNFKMFHLSGHPRIRLEPQDPDDLQGPEPLQSVLLGVQQHGQHRLDWPYTQKQTKKNDSVFKSHLTVISLSKANRPPYKL